MPAYIANCIAVTAYMVLFMFWKKGESIWFFEPRIERRGCAAQVLWAIAAISSVFSIYKGVTSRS